jgi:ABC-type glutathione transport system ATPase component
MSLSLDVSAPPLRAPSRSLALEASGLTKAFVSRTTMWSHERRTIALSDVSFDLKPSEVLAVVGESGSGKTTLGRLVVGLETPDAGWIRKGSTTLVDTASRVYTPAARRGIGMIFQDPNSSLNPRMNILSIVGEGLQLASMGGREVKDRVGAALDLVGLRREDMDRYPHQFSGGQRQRIGIARAIVVEPTILVADEAVSSLDVSVQMQVLNLILDIRDKLGLAVIFITHNIGVVEYLCDHVIVLSKGEVVERGTTVEVVGNPQHPYTKRLLSAVPRI